MDSQETALEWRRKADARTMPILCLLPKGPDARRVSGASDCSDPRSGADNREALAAKRPIPPRVAGLNTSGLRTAHPEE